MTPETRTDYGIRKRIYWPGGKAFDFDLSVRAVHGHVQLRRAIDRRHVTTDSLEPHEALHYAQRIAEEAKLALADKEGVLA